CGKDLEMLRQGCAGILGSVLTAIIIKRLTTFMSARRFCGAAPMNKFFANAFMCDLIGVLSSLAIAQDAKGKHWLGMWARAPQPPEPGHVKSFRNQTLRLIVHPSTGGTRVRIKISKT